MPCAAAIDTLRQTLQVQRAHWPCVARLSHTISYSHAEALQRSGGGGSGSGGLSGGGGQDDTHATMSRLASLSVVKENDG